MASNRARRWRSGGVGLFLSLIAIGAAGFGASQVQGLSESRSIQHGPTVRATRVSLSSAGAHGGAWLIVRYTTAAGVVVLSEVHDGDSDGVHQRASLPVRYDVADPQAAEVAGQPMHTPGQAVTDFVLAGVCGVAALLFLLAALGYTPLAGLGARRSRSRRRPRP